MRHVMGKFLAGGTLAALMLASAMQAQEFKVGKVDVQVHGFGTQGYVKTNDNNWLTMNTSGGGSGAFTDAGLNLSSQITPKLRFAAQGYDRRLGQLGDWHPALDWAIADFQVKPWLGLRGGKVKTILGLYNDSQDLDSAHTFALLPQSVYPTDMRDATLAHMGGDVYGTIKTRQLGKFSYTGYVGDQFQSVHGGYPYLLHVHGIYIDNSGGLTYGGDLRWQTPVKGLLAGVSYEENHVRNTGQLNPSVALGGPNVSVPYWEQSRSQFTKTIYGTYTHGNLRIDSEYRYFWRDFTIFDGQFLALIGTHALVSIGRLSGEQVVRVWRLLLPLRRGLDRHGAGPGRSLQRERPFPAPLRQGHHRAFRHVHALVCESGGPLHGRQCRGR